MDQSVGGAVSREPAARSAAGRDLAGPAGRLALSVVVDGRSDAATAAQVAKLVGRLQLAGVWSRQPPLTGTPADDLAMLLAILGAETAPSAAGLIADANRTGPGLLSSLPGADRAGRASPTRLAVCGAGPLSGQWLGRLAEVREALGTGLALPAAAAPARASPPGSTCPYRLTVSWARQWPVPCGRQPGGRCSSRWPCRWAGPRRRRTPGQTVRSCSPPSAIPGARDYSARWRSARPTRPGWPTRARASWCVTCRARMIFLMFLAQLREISVGAGVLRPGEPPSSPPPPPTGWGGRRPCAS